MRLQFFKDCKTAEQVKETFRTLAKKHHPDLGGNQEDFIKLKTEYDYVIKYGVEPTTDNANWMKDFFTVFSEAADVENQFRSNSRRYTSESFGGFRSTRQAANDHQAFKNAEEQRIKNYFDIKSIEDVNYGIIEGIIAEGLQKEQDNKWFLFELFKLDDLDIDHFKYVQWKMDLRKGWAMEAYQNYIKSNSIKWK